jgi:hypothetical protein
VTVIIQGPFGHVAEGPLGVEGRMRVRRWDVDVDRLFSATEGYAGSADGSGSYPSSCP